MADWRPRLVFSGHRGHHPAIAGAFGAIVREVGGWRSPALGRDTGRRLEGGSARITLGHGIVIAAGVLPMTGQHAGYAVDAGDRRPRSFSSYCASAPRRCGVQRGANHARRWQASVRQTAVIATAQRRRGVVERLRDSQRQALSSPAWDDDDEPRQRGEHRPVMITLAPVQFLLRPNLLALERFRE
jgi:hypothetical protein